MDRTKLIDKISFDNQKISRRESEIVVDLIFDEISEEIAKGGRVEIRGFGSFSLNETQDKRFVNPKTKKETIIKGKKKAYFKPAKELKSRIN
tara:strand:+ start:2461 stop:2736 length:276 start_codon:yes stop_codon:yes gene_type:complete